MRRSNWTPSIVPSHNDETVYLVSDDFGKVRRAWREADYEATDLETVIRDLPAGQFSNPIRIVAFNTAERWSEDVSEDVRRLGAFGRGKLRNTNLLLHHAHPGSLGRDV